MSQERSAEWLQGAVESHINTCNLITSITSTTASHPARQGLMAAGNELHNQLDRYRRLLAEAEAREASVPTAAEVIAAAERALELAQPYPISYESVHVGLYGATEMTAHARQNIETTDDAVREALAAIAKWKEAQRCVRS